MKKDVVIVAGFRTPISSFGGMFQNVSAVSLGATVVKKLLEHCNLEVENIDEVIFGNVLRSGLGQNVARQIAIAAGIPETRPSFSIDHVCGSGLKAITIGAQTIMTGDANIVVAGGVENMSQAPFLLKNYRFGRKLGNDTINDTIIDDGLTDAFAKIHMGITAENIAEKYQISREEQDKFALESQAKTANAIKNNKFADEIVPVSIPQKKGANLIITKDEYPKPTTTIEQLKKLRPAFLTTDDGTVTAGNSSGINDGAAAVLLMSKDKAKELDLPILGTIVDWASAGVSPDLMGIGPVPATKKALEKAGLSITDLGLVEANEAFAAQSIAVLNELNLNANIVNVNGGAIALGHPIGASGCRIVVTLLHEMKKRSVTYGLATLCIGGGQGLSVIVKRT